MFGVPPSVLEQTMTYYDMVEVMAYYKMVRLEDPNYEPTKEELVEQLEEYLSRPGAVQ